MTTDAAALVAATGGAGTTRLCVEAGGLLAAEGDHAVVLDAAYATQGLARHLPGRIDPDLTALVTDDRPLADGLHAVETAGAGRLEVAPVRAPFERLARAKTPEAAQRFESLVAAARDRADRVLVDTPPVAANQAVAAVTAADRVTLVAPGTPRGGDSVPRARDRLTDLGVDPAGVIATRTDDAAFADAVVPTDRTPAGETLVADEGTGAFTEGVAAAAELAFETEVDRAFDTGGLL
jgi:MinD-like ATPase involved in chromosome partitioning or flagellar assembly